MQTNAEVSQQYNRRILFIDDDVIITSMLEKIFERLGYEFFMTTRPPEALRMVQAYPDRFDLVITDLTLPEMNGLELAKEILNTNPALPIVLCTGSNILDDKTLRETGITTLLLKPFTIQKLDLTIQDVLDNVAK